MAERELTDLEKEAIEQDERNFPDDPADHYWFPDELGHFSNGDPYLPMMTVYTVNGNERYYETYEYCGKERMAMSYRFVKGEN